MRWGLDCLAVVAIELLVHNKYAEDGVGKVGGEYGHGRRSKRNAGKRKESRERESRMCSPVERMDKNSRSCVAWMGARAVATRGRRGRGRPERPTRPPPWPPRTPTHSVYRPQFFSPPLGVRCPRCPQIPSKAAAYADASPALNPETARLAHAFITPVHLHQRVARARSGRGTYGGVSKFWTCSSAKSNPAISANVSPIMFCFRVAIRRNAL